VGFVVIWGVVVAGSVAGEERRSRCVGEENEGVRTGVDGMFTFIR
jgi:hypothetical protein